MIVVAAVALFAAFLLGWLAGWLTLRPAPAPVVTPAKLVEPPPPTIDAAALSAAQDQARSANAALDEAMIEIEELRAYIDRRLTKQPDA